MKRSTVYTIFAIMLIGLLAVTWISANIRQKEQPFDIGDLSGADRAAAAEAYAADRSDENLITLLKILCYQYKIEGDETLVPEIREYGQELLDRAKDRTIDLEKTDREQNGVILQILNVIRSTGAR